MMKNEKNEKNFLHAQEKRGGKKRKECLKGYSPRQAQNFISLQKNRQKNQTQKKSDFEHPKKNKRNKK